MQAMTAHVNQLSGRRELSAMPPGGDPLVERADGQERYDNSKNGHLPIVQSGRAQCNLERSVSLKWSYEDLRTNAEHGGGKATSVPCLARREY
jgi:hypothetical protein